MTSVKLVVGKTAGFTFLKKLHKLSLQNFYRYLINKEETSHNMYIYIQYLDI